MALMEVVVSAALVAMFAVGLLTVFDVAGATSGTNKSRATAASIAQDDQELMRGLEVRTLLNRGTQTRTVKAGKVTYTVKSTSEIVTDSVDEGCTTGAGGIDYLKIRTEVTWPNMRIDPVVVDSLMTPRPGSFGPNEGGLSIQIVNRVPAPVGGVLVSLSGPGAFSDTTDENGCAFFTYIPTGNYNVSFSQDGKVTPGGVTDVNEPVGVPNGAVSNKIFSYDTAARLTANFITWTGNTASTAVADRGTSFAAAHTNIPAPGAIFFASSAPPTPPPLVASITTPFALFPFTSTYSAYAGKCVDQRPELQTPTPQTSATVSLGPGVSGTVNVLEPSLNVWVRYNSNTGQNGANLRFYDKTCGGGYSYVTQAVTGQTNPNGRIPFPGLPYGVYDICADWDPAGATVPRRFVRSNNVANNDPDRESITLNILANNSANGTCPVP